MTVEILGTLDFTANPYVQYMQAVSCFDLCPVQGSIVLLDSTLTVRKSSTVHESECRCNRRTLRSSTRTSDADWCWT